MKKIFTLFMATVVAMSMMAVPQVKKVGKKVQPTSKEQFEAKTPAQAKTLEMANDAKVLRSFERPETAVKKAPAKAPLKVAAAQAADTVKLHFDGFSVVPEYYEESGDWYMACSNGEGWIVKFDILAESYIGTFTEADLDLYYSYIYTPTDMVDYEKVALTITETVVSQYCKTVNLHAVIDGTDGNVYVVTCAHNFLSPKATVEETITGASLVWDGEKSVITGKNTDLDMTLAVWATWPTGPFTQGELDMAETSVVYKGVKQTLMGTDMLVASTLLEDGNVAYVADVTFYNQDTTLVKANVTCPLPAATDTVNISLNNLTVDDSWAAYFGWVYLTGVNSEWDVYGGVAAMEAAEGTWASEDEVMLYITNLKTGEKPEAVYATATLVSDDEKGWLVTIEGYCTDGKYYVVDMKYEVPEPTKTVKISFDNCSKASFYPDMENDLMLANDNGEYYVALDIYGVPMGGEFTLDNMDSYYTQLIDWTNMVEVQIADVKGVVSQNGDTTKMVAEIIGFDAVLYQVELWFAVPTPKETVTLTVDATFDNNLQYGYYTLHGQANEKELLVAMSPLTEVVEGTYVNDGLFGKFGEGGQHDFYASYTYVAEPTGDVDEYGDPEYNVYSVDKVTMVVTLKGDDIVAKVSAICSNAVQYEITMTAKYDKAHLEYDSETPVERAYTAADAVEVEYDEQYGLVYWGVEAADGSDMCALYFFVEEADAETVLPAGVYTIDDSQDYGTVLASEGYDGTYVYPSLYATYSAMNPGYLSELWFMVGGTVTVEKVDGKLKVVIDAINSYDQEIKITYNGESEDPKPQYYEDVITNMVFDLENMVIIGGPSENFQLDVFLQLGEDDGSGEFQLTEESSVAVMGSDAKFIDGIAYEIDAYAPAALVDLVVEWNGMLLQFHLTMSAAPMEATIVVVEDATIEVEKYLLFGDTYDYALKMTGNWINEEDGLTYPVLVEIPVYYPESTEPYEMMATVTVGGWGDNDPWLGFGEGYLTISTVEDVVTATGIVENPMTGIAIDITISGTITSTGIDNVEVEATAMKTIKKGQLIIVRDGKEYNAQGAQVK